MCRVPMVTGEGVLWGLLRLHHTAAVTAASWGLVNGDQKNCAQTTVEALIDAFVQAVELLGERSVVSPNIY